MKPYENILEPFFKRVLEQRGYVVEARLGRGGEAIVYQAVQAGLGKCAIKVHRQEVDDPAELPRHLREGIDVAVELRSSPYFVTLYCWFVEQSVLFTVWELSNGTLRDLLESRLATGQGPFSRQECCHYLHNVAIGLDELDARSGVHGDIKPENLLIFGKDVVKIGDLGISRLMTSLTTRHTDMRSHLYSLPRRHIGPPTRERDLFAFAVTYVELRLGRHAYGTTIAEATHNLIDNRPQLNGLDDDEVKLVQKLLLPDDAQPSIKSIQATDWLEQIRQSGTTLPHPQAKPVEETCAHCQGLGFLRLANNSGIVTSNPCPQCGGKKLRVLRELADLIDSIHESQEPQPHGTVTASETKTKTVPPEKHSLDQPATLESEIKPAPTSGTSKPVTPAVIPPPVQTTAPKASTPPKAKPQETSLFVEFFQILFLTALGPTSFWTGLVFFWTIAGWLGAFGIVLMLIGGLFIWATVYDLFQSITTEPLWALPFITWFGLFVLTPPYCMFYQRQFSAGVLAASQSPVTLSATHKLLRGVPNGPFASEFEAVSFDHDGQHVMAAGKHCVYSWSTVAGTLYGRRYLETASRAGAETSFLPESLAKSSICITHSRKPSDGTREMELYWSPTSRFLDVPGGGTKKLLQPAASFNKFGGNFILINPADKTGDLQLLERYAEFPAEAPNPADETDFHIRSEFKMQEFHPFGSHKDVPDSDGFPRHTLHDAIISQDGSTIVGYEHKDGKPGSILSDGYGGPKTRTRKLVVIDVKTRSVRTSAVLPTELRIVQLYQFTDSKRNQVTMDIGPGFHNASILSANGQRLAIKHAQDIRVYDTGSLQLLVILPQYEQAHFGEFTSDGKLLVVYRPGAEKKDNGILRVVDAKNGDVVYEHACRCRSPRFGGKNDEYLAGIASGSEITLLKWR